MLGCLGRKLHDVAFDPIHDSRHVQHWISPLRSRCLAWYARLVFAVGSAPLSPGSWIHQDIGNSSSTCLVTPDSTHSALRKPLPELQIHSSRRGAFSRCSGLGHV